MASATRTVAAIGIPVFDFVTTRSGTVSFFSNDLNITFQVTAQPTPSGALIRIHAGPILFLASFSIQESFRIQIVPQSIGSGFPPPPLSLLQLQTDTVLQVPTGLDEPDPDLKPNTTTPAEAPRERARSRRSS